MATGLTKGFMSMEDIVNLVPVEAPKKRGAYKKLWIYELGYSLI